MLSVASVGLSPLSPLPRGIPWALQRVPGGPYVTSTSAFDKFGDENYKTHWLDRETNLIR